MSVKTMMSCRVLSIILTPMTFTDTDKSTYAALTMIWRASIAKHLLIIVHGYFAKFHSKPNKL